jgi:hypothetical protein
MLVIEFSQIKIQIENTSQNCDNAISEVVIIFLRKETFHFRTEKNPTKKNGPGPGPTNKTWSERLYCIKLCIVEKWQSSKNEAVKHF